MSKLSPSAQLLLDEFNGYNELVNRRIKIAAVLRAAASQLKLDSNQNSQLGILYSCQEQLNSIADELDYDRQNSQ